MKTVWIFLGFMVGLSGDVWGNSPAEKTIKNLKNAIVDAQKTLQELKSNTDKVTKKDLTEILFPVVDFSYTYVPTNPNALKDQHQSLLNGSYRFFIKTMKENKVPNQFHNEKMKKILTASAQELLDKDYTLKDLNEILANLKIQEYLYPLAKEKTAQSSLEFNLNLCLKGDMSDSEIDNFTSAARKSAIYICRHKDILMRRTKSKTNNAFKDYVVSIFAKLTTQFDSKNEDKSLVIEDIHRFKKEITTTDKTAEEETEELKEKRIKNINERKNSTNDLVTTQEILKEAIKLKDVTQDKEDSPLLNTLKGSFADSSKAGLTEIQKLEAAKRLLDRIDTVIELESLHLNELEEHAEEIVQKPTPEKVIELLGYFGIKNLTKENAYKVLISPDTRNAILSFTKEHHVDHGATNDISRETIEKFQIYKSWLRFFNSNSEIRQDKTKQPDSSKEGGSHKPEKSKIDKEIEALTEETKTTDKDAEEETEKLKKEREDLIKKKNNWTAGDGNYSSSREMKKRSTESRIKQIKEIQEFINGQKTNLLSKTNREFLTHLKGQFADSSKFEKGLDNDQKEKADALLQERIKIILDLEQENLTQLSSTENS